MGYELLGDHFWPAMYPGIIVGVLIGLAAGGVLATVLGAIGGLAGAMAVHSLLTATGADESIVSFAGLLAGAAIGSYALARWASRPRGGQSGT